MKRNVLLTMLMITILVIAIIATFLETNSRQGNQSPQFTLKLSSSNGTVKQGENVQINANVSYVSGKKANVTLTATVNATGLNYKFENASGTPNFSTNLTINVPYSVSSNYYTVKVIASNGVSNQSAEYTFGVLSSQLMVICEVSFNTSQTIGPYTVTFWDTSGKSYGIKTSNTLNLDHKCAQLLNNRDTYDVSLTYTVISSLLHRNYAVVADLGSFQVSAPVGQTYQVQNFTILNVRPS